MTPIASAPQALDKASLIEMAQGPLTKMFQETLDRQIEVDRFVGVAIALRNELFWRGKQHLSLTLANGADSIVWDASSLDTEAESNQQVLRYYFNITRSDGQKFVAVVGTRAPHAKVDPVMPEDTTLARKARRNTSALRYLAKEWESDRVQKDIARILWKTGPAFIWTRYSADGDKYGYSEEPILGTEEITVSPAGYVCPACLSKQPEPMCADCQQPLSPLNFQEAKTATAPKVLETKRYPNGGVIATVHGTLEVVIQRSAKRLEETDYLRIQRLMSRASIFATYSEQLGADWLLKDDGDASMAKEAGTSSAEQARKQLESPDLVFRADPANLSGRVTDDWIKASYYDYIQDVQVREALRSQFPDGLHVTRVGEKIVDLLHGRITDEWSVCKTGTDDLILSDALCNDLIPINEAINNFFNLAIQIVLQSVPKTLVDSTLLKKGADTRAIVNEVIPVKAQVGSDLSKMMAQLPTARFSDQLMPLADTLRAYGREIDGVMESLFGGGPTTQTWREAELRKNQALQQLGTAFEEMVAAWKSAYTNGLRLLSEHGVDEIAVAPEKSAIGAQTEVVDPELIDLEGCEVSVNESIPMSAVEEREAIMFQLQNFPPEVQQVLGLTHPASIPRIHQLLNLSGIYCPGENEKAKVNEIIRRLLAEPPVQSIDPMTGMPILQPAIMPDPVLDDHGLMYELARSWCNSEAGLTASKENPEGFAHVRLFAEAQKMALAASQMPVQAPGGPEQGPPPNGEGSQKERMAQ